MNAKRVKGIVNLVGMIGFAMLLAGTLMHNRDWQLVSLGNMSTALLIRSYLLLEREPKESESKTPGSENA
jgi:hypothetical protein